MPKKHLALFLLALLCGCAASAPKMDQKVDQKVDQKDELAPVREALRDYNDCLKLNVKPYLRMKTKPKAVADAVAVKCERKLSDYKFAVRDVFVEGLNPESDGYNKILISKPEAHADRIREKGKRATIARVQQARKPAAN
jgi:hypothetical protein